MSPKTHDITMRVVDVSKSSGALQAFGESETSASTKNLKFYIFKLQVVNFNILIDRA